MHSKYLLVDKSILPDYYEKVIEARSLLSSGKINDVSEAVKVVGISRNSEFPSAIQNSVISKSLRDVILKTH